MNHCEICGKDFYSDTEFEQDQQMHKIESMNREGQTLLAQIFTQFAMMNIFTIQRRDRCTFEEACRKHFESQDILHAISTKLRMDKWGR